MSKSLNKHNQPFVRLKISMIKLVFLPISNVWQLCTKLLYEISKLFFVNFVMTLLKLSMKWEKFSILLLFHSKKAYWTGFQFGLHIQISAEPWSYRYSCAKDRNLDHSIMPWHSNKSNNSSNTASSNVSQVTYFCWVLKDFYEHIMQNDDLRTHA